MKSVTFWAVFLICGATVSCGSEQVRTRGGDQPAVNDPDRTFERPPATVGDDDPPEPAYPFEGGQELEFCGPTDLVQSPYVPSSGEFVFVDRETGSSWNLRGEAFEGPCTGARLNPIPSFVGMWFAWSGTRPGGLIWPEGVNDQPGPQPDSNGDCLVNCTHILSGGPAPDGIPALDHLGRWNRPKEAQMVPLSQVSYVRDTDRVLGVIVDGEARAYPHNIGWWHEIHTDQIGDTEFSVTFCPLTASGVVYPTKQAWGDFVPYVSGRLFNSNLTMWERDADNPTFWNQYMNQAIRGPHMNKRLEILPVVEMTWKRWKELYPDSLVASDDTGYSRDYQRYPYDDFETDHNRWVVNPTLSFGDEFGAKDLVLVVDGADTSKAWPWPAMDDVSDRLVINDQFDEKPLVVVYDAENRHAQPYDRVPGERTLTFSADSAP